jgi:tryptophan synthase alpha chain
MERSTIRAAFTRANAGGRAAFVAYLVVGYPDLATSIALAQAVAEAGADAIELGVPFSDPLADGATIQRASQIALDRGTTLATCFDAARQIAESTAGPLALMGYYNPFLRMGLDEAFRRAADAGVGGVIIPDLPVEEAGPAVSQAQAHHVSPIFLVTPTSPEVRIARIAAAAQEAESGFLYCVSLSGVTGARASLPADLPAFVARVRHHAGNVPLGIGFGISQPEHAALAARLGDGIIVGSALLNAFDAAPADGIAAVATLVRSLREAARIADGRSAD